MKAYRAGCKAEKTLMHIRTTLVAHAKASRLTQPTEGTLHNISELPSATAMRRFPPGEKRFDFKPSEKFPNLFRIAPAVATKSFRSRLILAYRDR